MLPRRLCSLIVLALALLLTASPVRAEVNCGAAIPATMIDTMSTAHSYPGERFRFKTTAPAKHDDVELPIGTTGWGIVRYVHHAQTHNRGGLIVLEPRVLVVGSTEVNIMGDPREAAEFAPAYTLAEEGLGLAPIGIFGTALNFARFGREVTLGPGFTFHIIVVDDIAEKEPCVQIAPVPSASPSDARRQSSPSPGASPSP